MWGSLVDAPHHTLYLLNELFMGRNETSVPANGSTLNRKSHFWFTGGHKERRDGGCLTEALGGGGVHHKALGAGMKGPGDTVGCYEGPEQTESSEPLTAPQHREGEGRKKGGGAEAPKWDQRRTHQGLVSFFFFLWQGREVLEGAWVEPQWHWRLHGEPVADIIVQLHAVVASLTFDARSCIMMLHAECRFSTTWFIHVFQLIVQ